MESKSIPRPLVLLALGDEPIAHALHAALLDHDPPLRIRAVGDGGSLVEACATEAVSLVVMSSTLDESGGARTLRELSAFGQKPEVVVLFDDPSDKRRALVSKVGAHESVLSPDRDLAPLIALVDRVMKSEKLEARLDASTRQFRVLVENSSDGIYILKQGRFAYTNKRFQEMVGYTADELAREDFDLAAITAPESRAYVSERGRRQQQGLPLEPRYEFVAMRRTGDRFDAQISISYIEFEGAPASLGIIQDITERKQFEQQLLRKNRELALLNDLAASINQALAIDDTLRVGCRGMASLLGAEAAGITLLAADGSSLELAVQEGLNDPLIRALADVGRDDDSLLANAVRRGQVFVVDDIQGDRRVAIDAVKGSGFAGCIVVPVKAHEHILGAAFAFTKPGRALTSEDRDLMVSIGTLLGNAIEKASLLDEERQNVRRLKALDEIAVALASTLDLDQVALTVARQVHRLFGAVRVMIARLDGERGLFLPEHVLDGGEPVNLKVPIPRTDTIMGLALEERRPVQRIRPNEVGGRSIDPFTDKPVALLPYEVDMFRQGVGAGVAVPVLEGGVPVGAMWLGYAAAQALSEADLAVLSSLGTHVAIAIKNSSLFAARNQALEDLQAAQDKLVQAERLNAIAVIAAGVAHDFNNVLGAILGRAQLLKSQLRDPALRKHAEVIETAAIDGAETVRRIQQIGKQERVDDFVPVNLDNILLDTVELTQPRWRDQPLQAGRVIDVSCEASTPAPMVSGNPHELREVLINLVHNAVDAMPAGGRIVLCTVVDDPNSMCMVQVKDTGTGMPKDVRERIFDPFFTTKGDRGTGLGLSVSQSIIRRHGGEISVASKTEGEGRGTTFTIALPRLQHTERSASTTPDLTTPVARTGNLKARVLVIDDEENIRDILTDILVTGEHTVVTAADGHEGLRKLDELEFDLVFTDLGLPGMSGYDVAAAVKKKRPDLPVGLVTGWGATLDPEKAKAHGVDLVLSKPFRFDQVLRLVDEALSARAALAR